MKNFFINVRNVTASLFSWLIFVWMLCYTSLGIQEFELRILWQLFTLSVSWGIIFTTFYRTNIFSIKRVTPIKKFTQFLVVCTLVESVFVYAFGLFGITSSTQWLLFLVIVLILYTLSLGLFQLYKTRAKEKYAKLLLTYQQASDPENLT